MKKLLFIALMTIGSSSFALEAPGEYPNFDKALAAAFPSKADQERIRREILISIGTLREAAKRYKDQLTEAAKKANITVSASLTKSLDQTKAEIEKLLNEKLEELKQKAKNTLKK